MRARRLQVLVVAVFMSVACGGGNTNSGSAPFNVLTVAAISGGLGPAVNACLNAYKAAAISLNAEGGILGHKLVFKQVDTGGNTTQAVTLVTQALQEKPEGGGTWNFIFSGASSDEQLAELPVTNKYKVIGMGLQSSVLLGNPSNFPYHFGVGVNLASEAKAIADYMVEKGYKKIGFFFQNNAVGQSTEKYIVAALKAANLDYVEVSYPATAIDVTPQLQQLQGKGVDSVIAAAQSGPWIGYVLKGRTKLGFNVPFVGDASFSGADAYKIAGAENLNGVTYAIPSVNFYKDPSETSAAFKSFVSNLKQVTDTYTVPLHQYSACWDQMFLMKIAAEQVNSLDPDKLKDALENLKIPSPSPLVTSPTGYGWTSSSPEGHIPINPPGYWVIRPIGPIVDGQVRASA